MRRNKIRAASGAAVILGLFLTGMGAWAQMGGGAPPARSPNMGSNPGGMESPGMQSPGGLRTPGMNTPNHNDMFVSEVRRNINVETNLSKMALKNSTNDDVKKMAQDVIEGNKQFSMALTSEMNRADSSVMPFAVTVSSETRKAEKQMKKLTGKQFDEMYLSHMDAYVKNDKKIATDASEEDSSGEVASVAMQLRSAAEAREKQIAQVAGSEGFKLP